MNLLAREATTVRNCAVRGGTFQDTGAISVTITGANVYIEVYIEIETNEVYNPVKLAEAAKARVDVYSCLDDFTNGDLRIWHIQR